MLHTVCTLRLQKLKILWSTNQGELGIITVWYFGLTDPKRRYVHNFNFNWTYCGACKRV